jgi:hypothetical protein
MGSRQIRLGSNEMGSCKAWFSVPAAKGSGWEVTENPVFKDMGLESLNDHDLQASSTFGTPGYSGFDWPRCD